MKVLVFSAKDFEIKNLEKLNAGRHKMVFVPEALDSTTAVMAAGYDAVCIFLDKYPINRSALFKANIN